MRLFPVFFIGVCLLHGCDAKRIVIVPEKPGCLPLFVPAEDPQLYRQHSNELVVLFPPEGALLQTASEQLVSGRAFGDFGGGVRINGQPAQMTGNAFHAWVPSPQSGQLVLEIIAKGENGAETARKRLTVEVGDANSKPGIGTNMIRFFPRQDTQTFFDLVSRSCADHVHFLMLRDPLTQGKWSDLEDDGILITDWVASRYRPTPAIWATTSVKALKRLPKSRLQELGVRWLGPVVPEMKYSRDTLKGFTDQRIEDLELGDSLAGIPAITVLQVDTHSKHVAPYDQRFRHLVQQASPPWSGAVTDTALQVIIDFAELRWLLQDYSVQWVEKIPVSCPTCEGCVCDTSPCVTKGQVCPILFGEGARCEWDACVR